MRSSMDDPRAHQRAGAAGRNLVGGLFSRCWSSRVSMEEAEAHLVGRLLAPVDRRPAGCWGCRVGGRVVEVGDHVDPRPLRQRDRLGEVVEPLPVEVPAVDLDECPLRAVGPGGGQEEVLAEPVHVRGDADQVPILLDGQAAGDLVVGSRRRGFEGWG